MNCCKKLSTRRTFLAASGVAATTVALVGCSNEPEQDVFSGGSLTQALPLEDLAVGSSVQMAVGANQVLIFRETTDVVHAYSAVCTHQGCIVGVQDNGASAPFVCPCHASNFDKLTGEAIAGPAQRPLTRHATAIEDGWIMVEVEPA